ncbi:MAG: DUF2264 domain-containing protein [Puniceicoccaceae bacterium]
MSDTSLPPDYRRWQKAAEKLIDSLMALAEPDGSEIPLVGNASDHDANADRLEAYARPCLLAAFWLQSVPGEGEQSKRDQVGDWFRKALVRGTDPESPHYWGPNTNYHQNGVEIGLLACALLMAREYLWDKLSEEEQQQVGRFIATNRATGHVWNNHFYFAILALEFLREVGMDRPADAISVDKWFKELEGMYRGQGWFMDGMNQSYDHYNSYAFHFYGLLWSHLFGESNPERKKRWCSWATEFLEEYQYLFAASGEHPAFGRSITYRFNASAPFSLACLLDVSPLPAGRARRLCTRNLEFFLNKPIYQEQGAVGIGWHDVFPELSEKYTCAGSVYWAAKAFSTLLLPPDHEFWTADEEPLISEQGDFVRIQEEAGLIFRGLSGEVEIINAGTEITPVNLAKFGSWKWGKLAYRTGVGFQVGYQGEYYNKVCGYYSKDNGLTLEGGSDDRVHGRHYTLPLEMTEEHMSCTYALGDKVDQLTTLVESYVWWNKDWLLHFIWTDSYQEVQLNLGGYSLSSQDAGALLMRSTDDCLIARNQDHHTLLQPIIGFEKMEWDKRLDSSVRRSHVQAPYHAAPVAVTGRASGIRLMAALSYVGKSAEEASPWQLISLNKGSWKMYHSVRGEWNVSHPMLPDGGQM